MNKDAIAVCFAAAVPFFLSFPTDLRAADKSKFNNAHICKAGVAVVMGRDPKIVKLDRVEKDLMYVSYVRPDDRKRWAYKCRLEGQKIIWGADDGRWRTHPADSELTFAVSGTTLTIVERYSDGSATRKSFTAQQLGE